MPADEVGDLLGSGADRIEVSVDQGGVKRICVRDNGGGIDREDLALALSRHATSKIETLDDLDAIATLGFRGEALPSMASVSRMTLTSRVADADSGWRIEVDGGAARDASPAAPPQGTTVEVHDLFYNTPARRRFLRSAALTVGAPMIIPSMT